MLHLSYIKPHWPCTPPPLRITRCTAPDDVLPVKQHQSELDHAHPVLQGFRNCEVSRNFSRAEVRDTVIPTYMGLIKQIDDQLGVLFDLPRTAPGASTTP
ncbi:hypothetical protein ACTMU2_11520 [Cupriavidus basilensis]